MRGFKDSNNKFHPFTQYRKKRIQVGISPVTGQPAYKTIEPTGVKLSPKHKQPIFESIKGDDKFNAETTDETYEVRDLERVLDKLKKKRPKPNQNAINQALADYSEKNNYGKLGLALIQLSYGQELKRKAEKFDDTDMDAVYTYINNAGEVTPDDIYLSDKEGTGYSMFFGYSRKKWKDLLEWMVMRGDLVREPTDYLPEYRNKWNQIAYLRPKEIRHLY